MNPVQEPDRETLERLRYALEKQGIVPVALADHIPLKSRSLQRARIIYGSVDFSMHPGRGSVTATYNAQHFVNPDTDEEMTPLWTPSWREYKPRADNAKYMTHVIGGIEAALQEVGLRPTGKGYLLDHGATGFQVDYFPLHQLETIRLHRAPTLELDMRGTLPLTEPPRE